MRTDLFLDLLLCSSSAGFVRVAQCARLGALCEPNDRQVRGRSSALFLSAVRDFSENKSVPLTAPIASNSPPAAPIAGNCDTSLLGNAAPQRKPRTGYRLADGPKRGGELCVSQFSTPVLHTSSPLPLTRRRRLTRQAPRLDCTLVIRSGCGGSSRKHNRHDGRKTLPGRIHDAMRGKR